MRITIHDLQGMKERGERITMLTAYDYTSACIADQAGIPVLLVGDTVGPMMLGYTTTLPVTLEEMLYHTRAVTRGSSQALVIGDMPFLTYTTTEEAIQTARLFLQNAGAQAVKLEGGRRVAPVIARLVELGIPVMAHIGFTPQSIHQLSGTHIQGETADSAHSLIEDALALEAAGAFAIVLEAVPAQLARAITQRLRIPTIGTASGPWCDGQTQIWHRLLGLCTDSQPRSQCHADLKSLISATLRNYMASVSDGSFPPLEQSSVMDEEELQEALKRQSPSSL